MWLNSEVNLIYDFNLVKSNLVSITYPLTRDSPSLYLKKIYYYTWYVLQSTALYHSPPLSIVPETSAIQVYQLRKQTFYPSRYSPGDRIALHFFPVPDSLIPWPRRVNLSRWILLFISPTIFSSRVWHYCTLLCFSPTSPLHQSLRLILANKFILEARAGFLRRDTSHDQGVGFSQNQNHHLKLNDKHRQRK